MIVTPADRRRATGADVGAVGSTHRFFTLTLEPGHHRRASTNRTPFGLEVDGGASFSSYAFAGGANLTVGTP